MKIKVQMLLNYIIIFVIIIAIAITGVISLRSVFINGQSTYEVNLMSSKYLQQMNADLKEIDEYLVILLTDIENENKSMCYDKISYLQDKNSDVMDKYSKMNTSEDEKNRYRQCKISINQYNEKNEQLLGLIKNGNIEEAKKVYYQELTPIKACTYELIDAVVEINENNALEKQKKNERAFNRTVIIISIVTLAGIVITIISSRIISRRIIMSLLKINDLSERISNYDISEQIKDNSKDEFGEVLVSLNNAQSRIRDIISIIMTESTNISALSEELSANVQESDAKLMALSNSAVNLDNNLNRMIQEYENIMNSEDITKEEIANLKEAIIEMKSKSNIDEIQKRILDMSSSMKQSGNMSEEQSKIAVKLALIVSKFKL